MDKRKICVVTGTRAEYGLLRCLMQEIENDTDLELQIAVTGMHLSPEFGLTYKEIEADGFIIHEKIEILLSSDTPVGIAKSMGLALIGFADAFSRLQPDIVVVLGDRYEILAAAQAAMVARIPIAHLSGGEITEGAIDDAIRHAITKMSSLHFVSAEEYRRRVIQLGEAPERVYNFGDPGLDAISRMQLLEREALEKELNLELGDLSFLVTYHPATLGNQNPGQGMQELLLALDRFPSARILFTKPNSDAGGREIIRLLEQYAAQNPKRAFVFASLGHLRYLSALKHVDVVIGNSSSGIVEAPAFRKPTVNIGERQRGRLMAKSIITCEENREQIAQAIERALSDGFKNALPDNVSLYGTGKTSQEVKACLKQIDLSKIAIKTFHDLPISECER